MAGRVLDENNAPVSHARITVHCGETPAFEVYSGASGAFRLSLSRTSDCLLNVDRTGYFRLQNYPLAPGGVVVPSEVTVTLHSQPEVFQSVTVGAEAATLDPGADSA